MSQSAASGLPAPTPTPAGWYPHPTMPNTLGFWDGVAWTQNVAPAAPVVPPAAREPKDAPAAVAIFGWLGMFFVPIVGFALACVILATRAADTADRRRPNGVGDLDSRFSGGRTGRSP